MKRVGLLVIVALCGVAAGCDDDGPTSASGAPVVFSAQLSPANEVPAVSNAESTARGAAQVTFNVTRDSADVVTGGTATLYFQATGLPAGTTFRGAHIHSAVAGVNGPIVVDSGITAAAPATLASGTGEFTFTGITVSAATMNAILANPSAYYFNIHTNLNPGGVARGQLTPLQ
jgi:hypothetical protein